MCVSLFQGCASKDTVYPDPDADIKKYIDNNNFQSGNYQTKKVMPYQVKTGISVGTRSNDSKVVVNTGKVFKIYINSYKRGSTLISAHDIYTYVEKPGFIVGQNVPEAATDSVTTPIGKLPFRINGGELDVNTHKTEISNSAVKNFNNNIYEHKYGYTGKNSKKITKIEKERDNTILKYLESIKALKGKK